MVFPVHLYHRCMYAHFCLSVLKLFLWTVQFAVAQCMLQRSSCCLIQAQPNGVILANFASFLVDRQDLMPKTTSQALHAVLCCVYKDFVILIDLFVYLHLLS